MRVNRLAQLEAWCPVSIKHQTVSSSRANLITIASIQYSVCAVLCALGKALTPLLSPHQPPFSSRQVQTGSFVSHVPPCWSGFAKPMRYFQSCETAVHHLVLRLLVSAQQLRTRKGTGGDANVVQTPYRCRRPEPTSCDTLDQCYPFTKKKKKNDWPVIT